jgi:hypothetical protein
MGTATTIEGQAVVTSLGPGPMAEGGAEFLRLRAELLEGAGFFIAKVTPRPGHSGGCTPRGSTSGRRGAAILLRPPDLRSIGILYGWHTNDSLFNNRTTPSRANHRRASLPRSRLACAVSSVRRAGSCLRTRAG